MPCDKHTTASHQWSSSDPGGTKSNPSEPFRILACEKLCGWVVPGDRLCHEVFSHRFKNAAMLRVHVKKVHGVVPIPTAWWPRDWEIVDAR
ncbi:hypothetical protein HYFRA_00000454 [Hymenoscyphus fraxineus]|uniref:Uncharacterized protein n=1 Tax=Hymenoscyphus fraxineus TaxID=746836 RepID=A0A9N9L4T0_9HELO|nr:hypothetical protein HYFRA_00000454 [Hymenoscyphus fraxineus]